LSIAVSRGSELTYVDAYGYADITRAVAASPSTRYLWFSMTKLVTATAA
jgi:CubicO group peptidase (beta-lactamase class C family)